MRIGPSELDPPHVSRAPSVERRGSCAGSSVVAAELMSERHIAGATTALTSSMLLPPAKRGLGAAQG